MCNTVKKGLAQFPSKTMTFFSSYEFLGFSHILTVIPAFISSYNQGLEKEDSFSNISTHRPTLIQD